MFKNSILTLKDIFLLKKFFCAQVRPPRGVSMKSQLPRYFHSPLFSGHYLLEHLYLISIRSKFYHSTPSTKITNQIPLTPLKNDKFINGILPYTSIDLKESAILKKTRSYIQISHRSSVILKNHIYFPKNYKNGM